MVMALLAIIFFTTVSLLYNRSMWNQAENLDNVAKVMQATHVAHSKLDEIDAKLLSQQVAYAHHQPGNIPPTVQQAFSPTWNAISSSYEGTANVDLPYAGYNFNITYNFVYCDSTGSSGGISQTYDDTEIYRFIKMTVTVASTPGMSHPVAVYRVYTKTNFYLDY